MGRILLNGADAVVKLHHEGFGTNWSSSTCTQMEKLAVPFEFFEGHQS